MTADYSICSALLIDIYRLTLWTTSLPGDGNIGGALVDSNHVLTHPNQVIIQRCFV